MSKIKLIAEAARQSAAVLNYCDQARADAERGKRHMAFWCLDMAAQHRRRYIAARAAIAEAEKQEPVCAMCKSTHGRWSWMCDRCLLIHDKQPPAAPVQEPVKAPGMAVQALAGEIIEALLSDEEDGGYDLTAGLFGPAFSKLVRRWANAEWAAPPAAKQEPVAQDVQQKCRIETVPAKGGLLPTPPAAQRQPLTDTEIWRQYQALWPFHPAEEPRLASDLVKFARAIEAAHGITGEKPDAA
jgi:hypothetical protein